MFENFLREFAEGENTEDSQSVYEDIGINLPDETQIAQSENEFVSRNGCAT
jgi:hypothetical protein